MTFNKLLTNKSFLFLGFIIVYLIFAFSFNQFRDVWWDSASYIGMGKYIYSNGSQGVFEPMKSIGLPLMLGLGWKSGLDIVIFGKILALLAGLAALYFTYLIGKEVIDENAGLLASLVLFFNSLFLIFIFRIYTEIFSMAFILGAIYFMIRFHNVEESKHLIISALFCVLAFLVKYPNVLIFGLLNIYLIYFCIKNKKIKPLIIFNIWLLLFLLPFFIINYINFSNPIYLVNQAQTYFKANLNSVYGFSAFPVPRLIFSISPWIYFKSLFYLFNFLLIFIFLGIYKMFKEKREELILLIFIPIIIFFCFFEVNTLKQERYIMMIFPLLALLASYGFSFIKKRFVLICLILYIIIGVALAGVYLQIMAGEKSYYDFFSSQKINCSSVATSDPRAVLSYKLEFPYEVFDSTWEDRWIIKNNPECVFFFSCYEGRNAIITRLNELGYEKQLEKNTGRCLYAVLKK